MKTSSPAITVSVLDGNFSWTESLFSPLSAVGDVCLLKPKDFVTASQSGWPISTLFRSVQLSHQLTEKRFAFPPGWFSRFPKPFMTYLGHQIKQYWKTHRAEQNFLALSLPQYVRILDHCAPYRSLYYWSDDFKSYWPSRRQQIESLERECVVRTNVTVCASFSKANELRALLPAEAHKITHLVHGHHPSLLANSGHLGPRSLPADLAGLQRPILGHWGVISRHIDFDLVYSLARRFPAASLVFIGPIQRNFSAADAAAFDACKNLPNIHFLGPRPYADIAKYVPSFDVCLALYRPDIEFCRLVNPSKMRDYIAGGRPIVSMALPEVSALWPGLLSVAHSTDEYLESVALGVRLGCDGREQARLSYAREHTWELVAQRLWNIISAEGTA